MHRLKTIIFIAIFSTPAWIFAQNGAQNTNCPADTDIHQAQIFGTWQLQFEGEDQSLPLVLAQSKRYADGLSGTLTRGAQTSQIAGDLDSGVLQIEESLDGHTIDASFDATLKPMQPPDCVLVFRGVWTAKDGSEKKFEIRRPAAAH